MIFRDFTLVIQVLEKRQIISRKLYMTTEIRKQVKPFQLVSKMLKFFKADASSRVSFAAH